MPKVLIVYHSFTGKTKSLAEATAEAARGAGAEVTLLEASAACGQRGRKRRARRRHAATFGSLAGETKKFFERLDRKGQARGQNRFCWHRLHAEEPAATRKLHSAAHFGFTTLQAPLLVPVGELDAGQALALRSR